MARFLTFLIVFLLLVILELILSKVGIGTDITLQLWPTATQWSLPAALALTIAFAFGLLSMLVGVALARNLPSPASWPMLAAVFLAGLALIAVARRDVVLIRTASVAALSLAAAVAAWYALPNAGLPDATLPRAQIGSVGAIALLAASALLGDTLLVRLALALSFAAGALGVAYCAFTELRAGAAVETESRFGGLGGGLGGWRISSAAGLLLLTALLAGAAVALATYNPKSGDTTSGTTAGPREGASPGAARPTASNPDKKEEEHPAPTPAPKGS